MQINSWPTKKLGEIANIYSGTSEVTKRKDYVEKGHPAFSATGQDGFTKEAKDSGYAVILSSIGARCGKCFYAEGKWTSIANTQVIKPKRQKNSAVAKFLYFYLNDEKRWPRSGSAQPFIAPSVVKNLRVPFPPLPIQQKIVERLDAIKKAQELNNKQISLADELFQSLLRRELKHRESWQIKKLGEVCEKIEQSHPRKIFKEQFQYIDISSIDAEQKAIKNTTIVNVENAPSRARKLIKAKDILFATTRPYLERIAFVPDSLDRCIASTGFCVIRSNTKVVLPEYLYFTVLTKPFISKVLIFQKGASYPAVSDKDIYGVGIPLPPLKTQRKIVEKLSAVQEYKKKLLKQKELLQELFESTLNKAMKGELCLTAKLKIELAGG